jgi:hypothetical protein
MFVIENARILLSELSEDLQRLREAFYNVLWGACEIFSRAVCQSCPQIFGMPRNPSL